MLILMTKSAHEEHFVESLQTDKKQLKTAVTFLSVYNGFFSRLETKIKNSI